MFGSKDKLFCTRSLLNKKNSTAAVMFFFFWLWHFLKEIMTMPCTFMQDFFSLSLCLVSICVIDLSAAFQNKKNIVFRVRKHLKFCNTYYIYEIVWTVFKIFWLVLSGFVKKMVDQSFLICSTVKCKSKVVISKFYSKIVGHFFLKAPNFQM